MSISPSSEPSAVDPLGEALHRLEASIAGAASLPVARPKGQQPKSLVPEGEEVGGIAATPRSPALSSSPQALDAPPDQNGVSQAPIPVPVPRALGTVSKVEIKSPPKQRVADLGDPPNPAAPLPKTAPVRPKAAPLPVSVPSPPARSGDTLPLSEDEFLPYFDNGEAATVSVRKGNRRLGRSSWQIFLWVTVLQVAVLSVAALIAWPMLKGMLAADADRDAGVEPSPAAVSVAVPDEEVEALRAEIEVLRRQVSATPENAWKELEFLEGRNKLLESGDRAIENADRAAYDHLIKLAGGAEDERLRSGAAAEVLRVRFAYSTGLRTESHTLPVGQLFPSLRGKSEMALNTDQLVKVLLDTEVESTHRVKAAYLLADRRGGKAADALAAAVAEDMNLDVVREASMTFGEMTGYRSSDLLDTGRLGAWWETNAQRVKAVIGD